MNKRIALTSSEENGFAVTWVLGFAMIILLLGVFFYEIGGIMVERQKLVSAADSAATAGATAIDEDELIASGNVVLDETLAEQRCRESLDRAKNPTTGPARSILEQGGVMSDCDVVDDGGNSTIVVVARGRITFGALFSSLGAPTLNLEVTSRSRPSCSDDASAAGAC